MGHVVGVRSGAMGPGPGPGRKFAFNLSITQNNPMPFLTFSRLLWPAPLGLLLTLVTANVPAAQACKYESIRATAPASRFTDNGDGTVTDQATGLQWKRCAEGQSWSGGTCTGTASTPTWQQALQLADTASFAGHGDWRLPNIKELSSIVERACYAPAIDLAVFPATPLSWYWSASPYVRNSDGAWFVDFTNGSDGMEGKGVNGRVRLVRGAQ